MAGINYLSFVLVLILGFILGLGLTSQALTLTERQKIEQEQQTLYEKTGSYLQLNDGSLIEVQTYEALCKGYVIVEHTDTETRYLGYGPLSEQYTNVYEKILPNTDPATTSTSTIFER